MAVRRTPNLVVATESSVSAYRCSIPHAWNRTKHRGNALSYELDAVHHLVNARIPGPDGQYTSLHLLLHILPRGLQQMRLSHRFQITDSNWEDANEACVCATKVVRARFPDKVVRMAAEPYYKSVHIKIDFRCVRYFPIQLYNTRQAHLSNTIMLCDISPTSRVSRIARKLWVCRFSVSGFNRFSHGWSMSNMQRVGRYFRGVKIVRTFQIKSQKYLCWFGVRADMRNIELRPILRLTAGNKCWKNTQTIF